MGRFDAFLLTGLLLVSSFITARWLRLEADRLRWSYRRGLAAGLVLVVAIPAAWTVAFWRTGMFS